MSHLRDEPVESRTQKLGFTPDDRLVVRIDPPPPATDDPQSLSLVFARMQERLLRVPGITHASAALYRPMEGNNWSSDIAIAGRPRDPRVPTPRRGTA